ncbi:MAG TPA: DUF2325 domain-containing protein [Desulfosporosinus sp.]|nr:DUF2325 domain-containing protein [Desulfosporosinus sp.]
MKVLVVGADHLGNIPLMLRQEGVKEIVHWSGRNKSSFNKVVPKNIEKVIVFCDYINHNTMSNVKRQAKVIGIPVIYSKRALSMAQVMYG